MYFCLISCLENMKIYKCSLLVTYYSCLSKTDVHCQRTNISLHLFFWHVQYFMSDNSTLFGFSHFIPHVTNPACNEDLSPLLCTDHSPGLTFQIYFLPYWYCQTQWVKTEVKLNIIIIFYLLNKVFTLQYLQWNQMHNSTFPQHHPVFKACNSVSC